MAPKTRCLVWGAGAIGGTMGAFLSRAGHDVTLVDTVAEHIAAINRSGISITGPISEFTTPLPASTPDALQGTWDTIILATKAHHTDAAVRALRPHLTDSGCVISAQNGLNELTIAAVVGEERTIGAFVNFGADYLEPGVILYGGRGTVTVGEAFKAQGPSPKAQVPRPKAQVPSPKAQVPSPKAQFPRLASSASAIPGATSTSAPSPPTTSSATSGRRKRTVRCSSSRRLPTIRSPTPWRGRSIVTSISHWPGKFWR